MVVKEKISELLKRLNDGVFEKEEAIALTLLSAIAGESIFLLGSPGVAKSLIARRLKFAFKDGQSFEYLMNRFSTPDEIFGPVSISQLKDHDKYERIVNNYLPSATVVFLDEIWKAGPSIQNALLTVLNEKLYRNGEQEIKVPMKALISASNELPNKGEGLEALWDRFLVRLIVDSVHEKESFNAMISKPLNAYADTVTEELKITEQEYSTWHARIDKIQLPENVFNIIHVVRSYVEEYNEKEENKEKQIYISDRRWRKIVRLLRTSAFLNNRLAVDLMDCFLIKECLWNEAEQKQTVSQFVQDAIQKHGYALSLDLTDLKAEIKEFDADVKSETSFIQEENVTELAPHHKDYYRIIGMPFESAILIEDYKKLNTQTESYMLLYRFGFQYHNEYSQHGSYKIRKGLNQFIYINGTEYKLNAIVKAQQKNTYKTAPQALYENGKIEYK